MNQHASAFDDDVHAGLCFQGTYLLDNIPANQGQVAPPSGRCDTPLGLKPNGFRPHGFSLWQEDCIPLTLQASYTPGVEPDVGGARTKGTNERECVLFVLFRTSNYWADRISPRYL
jgi:hypothetical protein